MHIFGVVCGVASLDVPLGVIVSKVTSLAPNALKPHHLHPGQVLNQQPQPKLSLNSHM